MEQQQQQIKPLRLKIDNVHVSDFEILQIKDANDEFVLYFHENILKLNMEKLQNEILKLQKELISLKNKED